MDNHGDMARFIQRQNEFQTRKQEIERDRRFNLNRTIPKIGAETAAKFLEEIEVFEKEYAKTNPSGIKEWCMGLDDALYGRAKNWRDMVILTQPGKDIYERTRMRPS